MRTYSVNFNHRDLFLLSEHFFTLCNQPSYLTQRGLRRMDEKKDIQPTCENYTTPFQLPPNHSQIGGKSKAYMTLHEFGDLAPSHLVVHRISKKLRLGTPNSDKLYPSQQEDKSHENKYCYLRMSKNQNKTQRHMMPKQYFGMQSQNVNLPQQILVQLRAEERTMKNNPWRSKEPGSIKMTEVRSCNMLTVSTARHEGENE